MHVDTHLICSLYLVLDARSMLEWPMWSQCSQHEQKTTICKISGGSNLSQCPPSLPESQDKPWLGSSLIHWFLPTYARHSGSEEQEQLIKWHNQNVYPMTDDGHKLYHLRGCLEARSSTCVSTLISQQFLGIQHEYPLFPLVRTHLIPDTILQQHWPAKGGMYQFGARYRMAHILFSSQDKCICAVSHCRWWRPTDRNVL